MELSSLLCLDEIPIENFQKLQLGILFLDHKAGYNNLAQYTHATFGYCLRIFS